MRVFDETRQVEASSPSLRKRPTLTLPAAIAGNSSEIHCGAVKLSTLLDTATFKRLKPPPPGERVPLTIITSYGEKLSMTLNPKSVNKAHRTIREHGAANTMLVLTGRLEGARNLTDAGISVNIKAPK